MEERKDDVPMMDSTRDVAAAPSEDCVVDLNITLEELFLGSVKRIKLRRCVLCSTCKDKTNVVVACSLCHQTGNIVDQSMTLDPQTLVQKRVNTTRRCPRCNGSGQTSMSRENCFACHGHQVLPQDLELEVKLRGLAHGDEIRFPGLGDELPGKSSGDIVVRIHQLAHSMFARGENGKGYDLFCKKEVSLANALCGFQFELRHLDGRLMPIRTSSREPIKPFEMRCIRREGLPQADETKPRGHLYIQFVIVFPPKIHPQAVSVLKNIFPRLPEEEKIEREMEGRAVHPVQLVKVSDNFTG